MPPKSILGHRFGKLIVEKLVDIRWLNNRNEKVYLCICDCGRAKELYGRAFHHKAFTQSCGDCIRRGKEPVTSETYFLNRIYSQYKSGAKVRSLPFELTKDELLTLILNTCFFCGSEPTNICKDKSKTGQRPTNLYNGIDRIDNDLGYTKDNCVTCCKTCNYAKNKQTYNEFLDWINKIHKHVNKCNTAKSS